MTATPHREDINPTPENLDELIALEHFFGKSQSEASRLFFEYPTYYEEDLKWMGRKAFVFYFPSLEPYLMSEESTDDSDIIQALASTLQLRLEEDPLAIKECLIPIIRIVSYITSHITKYNIDPAIYGNLSDTLSSLAERLQIISEEGERLLPSDGNGFTYPPEAEETGEK